MGNETNTPKVIARLEREGWQMLHGGRHDKFEHPSRPEITLIVPRNRELSPALRATLQKRQDGCDDPVCRHS
jgi:predicted RNA binding protein YcfA (HicA-like mRNA interferase family)